MGCGLFADGIGWLLFADIVAQSATPCQSLASLAAPPPAVKCFGPGSHKAKALAVPAYRPAEIAPSVGWVYFLSLTFLGYKFSLRNVNALLSTTGLVVPRLGTRAVRACVTLADLEAY